MKDLTLKNAPPIISHWIIKYDDVFEMPQYIQGKLVNDYNGFKAKENIILDNLIGVDLGKIPRAYTTDGETFLLAGKGRRMFLVENIPPDNWLLESDDLDEDLDSDI